jgi:hypothetical protein
MRWGNRLAQWRPARPPGSASRKASAPDRRQYLEIANSVGPSVTKLSAGISRERVTYRSTPAILTEHCDRRRRERVITAAATIA